MYTIMISVEKEGEGKRVDSYVALAVADGNFSTGELGDESSYLSELSRSTVQKLIENGKVTIDGKTVKSNYKVRTGDLIEVIFEDPEELDIEAEDIPIDIVFEDSDIVVINKPRGMVVHPAPGNYSGTLVNALMFHCGELSDINGVKRPGIVHRIDKDTTGLLVVAKNNKSHHSLAEQIKVHDAARTYYAIVEGTIKESGGTVDAPVGRHPQDRKKMCVNVKNGKSAVTHFKVLERFEKCTFVECKLETGRTHQIRVHMQYIGHPVTGDPVYGIKNHRGMSGQALHAGKIEFTHPSSGEKVCYEADLPYDFTELLKKLRNGLIH
ncbi:MAG: RluA family pseudouridine synthase [Ruminococcaceae bacterium]|nr:RluA family pseudouridine synthase [Oscillospiraceae bacterium]